MVELIVQTVRHRHDLEHFPLTPEDFLHLHPSPELAHRSLDEGVIDPKSVKFSGQHYMSPGLNLNLMPPPLPLILALNLDLFWGT